MLFVPYVAACVCLSLLSSMTAGQDPIYSPSGGETTNLSSAGETTISPSAGETTISPSAGETTISPSEGETTISPSAGETTISPSSGESTSSPGNGEQVLQELQGMDQKLVCMQEALFNCSCCAVKSGISMEYMMDKFLAVDGDVTALKAKYRRTQQALEATQATLKATATALKSSINMKTGSSFVRWGRKACTDNSELVYSGVAGGSWYAHQGVATDLLCLPLKPQLQPTDKYTGGYLYGAEYIRIDNLHNHDVACSVCRAAQSTTIMIPATRTCPEGWTMQYAGHLVTGHYTNLAASQYDCLDAEAQNATARETKHRGGRLLYYTKTQCGSLPCPPYIDNQDVLCVVCSK